MDRVSNVFALGDSTCPPMHVYIRVASTHDVVRHSDGSPPAKCILATTTFPTDLSLDVPRSRHT